VDNQDSTPAAKHCAKCQQTKPLFEFGADRNRKYGVKAYCKPCHNATNQAIRRANLGKYKAIEKNWRDNNKDKTKARTDRWRTENLERSKQLAYRWRKENPEKAKASFKKAADKRRANAMFRIRDRLACALRNTLRCRNEKGSVFQYLGYTDKDLIAHFERQFLPGMGWHNIADWHIDHIVPLSSFHYNTPYDIEFQQAWALSNLRPLWAVDNLRKSNKNHFLL